MAGPPKLAQDTTITVSGTVRPAVDSTTQSHAAVVMETIPGIETGSVPFTDADALALSALINPPVVPTSWTQATWFVDPQNVTGTASDSNSGLDATHAVLSYNGGVVAKWGTVAPTLRQDTTITWLSSQPAQARNADPVICRAVMINAVITFKGNLDASTQIHSGVLGAVTAKNRGTGQLLNADLGFAAPLGSLIHNTTHDSWAWVYKLVGGSVFAITQPITRSALPLTEFVNPVEVNTWTVGDAVVIYQPTSMWIANVSCDNAEQQAATGFPCAAQLEALTLVSADGVTSDCDIVLSQVSAQFVHALGLVSEPPLPPFDIVEILQNCFYEAGAISRTLPVTLFNAGVLSSVGGIGTAVPWTLDFDAIVDATGGAIVIGTPSLGEGATYSGIAFAYVVGTVVLTSSVAIAAAIVGGAVWGPGTLNAMSNAHVVYAAGTAVARFLNAGGITLNSQNKASSYVAATGVWTGNISLTPANLDGGAFAGGIAINPGGASLSVQL